jgi:hypothetical protein
MPNIATPIKIGKTPAKVLKTFGNANFIVLEIKEYSDECSKYYTREIQHNIQPKPHKTSENSNPVSDLKIKNKEPNI